MTRRLAVRSTLTLACVALVATVVPTAGAASHSVRGCTHKVKTGQYVVDWHTSLRVPVYKTVPGC